MSAYMIAECVYGEEQQNRDDIELFPAPAQDHQSTSYSESDNVDASSYVTAEYERNNSNSNANNKAKCGRPVFNKTLDLVFKYGERNQLGARSAECMCGKVYGMARSRRLQSHAETCQAIPHATRQLIIQNAPKEKGDKEQQRQSSRRTNSREANKRNITIQQEERISVKKFRDDTYNHVNDALAKALALEGIPLAFLDNIMLRKSYSLLGHSLPDKNYFADLIVPRIIAEYENVMKRDFREAPPKTITIEFDTWKDIFDDSILAITASLQDGRIYLLRLIDDSKNIPTPTRVLEILTQTINEFVPYNKINAFISKQASNCLEARQKFTEQPGCEAIIGSRCLAHVLILIGYYASNNSYLKMRLQETENILAFLNANHSNMKLKINDKESSSPVYDVATRWYSIGLKLGSLFKNRRILENKALEDSSQTMLPELAKSILDLHFWADLEAARVFYEPLCKAISIAEHNSSNIAVTFNEMLSFARLCYETRNNCFRNIFLESFIKNFSKMDEDLVLACYALDPRYKSRYLTSDARFMAIKKVVSIGHSMGFNDRDSLAMFDDYDHYELRTGYYSTYKFVERNPFEWWRRGPSKTGLKEIACRLSLLKSSSANIERLFTHLSQSKEKLKINLSSMENSLRIRLMECANKLYDGEVSNYNIVHHELINCYESEVPMEGRQYFENLLDVKNMNIDDLVKTPEYAHFEKLVEFGSITPVQDEPVGPNQSSAQQERSSVEDLMEIYKRRYT